MNQRQVTMVFPDAGIGSRIFPLDLAEFLNSYYREKGVEVLAGEHVAAVEARGEETAVITQSGRERGEGKEHFLPTHILDSVLKRWP